MSVYRPEATVVLQNDKTYWFKDNFAGQEISPVQAISSMETLVGRKLVPFEFNLLMGQPVDGSKTITVVTMLAADPSQNNPLTSVRRVVIGYVVRRRENTGRYNYGDVVGTDGFYLTDGRLIGEISVTRKQEPGLVAPLIDPIDLAGGELAGLVRIGAKALLRAGAEVVASSFRDAMVLVERNLLARVARAEAAALRTITEEELAMAWGGGTANPLSSREVDEAIGLLRNGTDVHVESLGQMRQVQGELGQLGVRSESSSSLIPQRPAASTMGEEVKPELSGSYKAGPGTYRVDPAHGPGKVPYSSHNEYPHINITLRNGKKLAIIVTGSKSF